MIIKNGDVFTEKNQFEKVDVCTEGRLFSATSVDGNELDAAGCYVIPGLIDLHFHGCMGQVFCDGTLEALQTISEYELSQGVTAICPATMTLPLEELFHVLDNAAQNRTHLDGADLVGINMEGPFISQSKKGAQDERNILPCDAAICKTLYDCSDGLVKFVGIAPEQNPNYLQFINEAKDFVNVSLAHTNAGYEDAMCAFSAGANHAVHLYNAMSAFTHRNPGVVGAVADSPHVMAELICVGVHVHPAVVRATFQMLGPDRIIFISDSMRATGMEDGRYTLGGLDVDVKGNRATLVSNGALAGSVTNLLNCLRTAVQLMGIPLENAALLPNTTRRKKLRQSCGSWKRKTEGFKWRTIS